MKYKHTKKSSASIKSDTIFSWGKPIKQINVVIQKKNKKNHKVIRNKKVHRTTMVERKFIISIYQTMWIKMEKLIGYHK